jgi:hypothetical protein
VFLFLALVAPKRANQMKISKLDTRLPANATDKFGNHPLIISVGDDVQMFFYF